MNKVQLILSKTADALAEANRLGLQAVPLIGTITALAESVIDALTPDDLETYASEIARVRELIAQSRALDEQYDAARGESETE